ncbi:phosphopyruvate hydratase [Candidatus Woesearchaeota archaeon]|nr:phosphopyruvate hydratase [Candidatus Woesearchaeota archaeon]
MKIKAVKAREILDSRGNPTVEVDVKTDDGVFRASVPSGASTGIHEALELRDDDKRYLGKGVLKAVSNVNKKIAPLVKGMDVTKQAEIDKKMINAGGNNKKKFGANAILGVSMAVCKAGAAAKKVALYKYIAGLAGVKKLVMPIPSMNVINGGKHAGNPLDIQEYMILPVGAKNFRNAMQAGAEVYHILKKMIKEECGIDATNVGDEGGFAPPLNVMEEPIKLIQEAIDKAGYNGKVKIGIDAAASEFFKDKRYIFEGKIIGNNELINKYTEVVKKYRLVSIEDPFDQDDWDSYVKLTKSVGKEVQIVGDDLLVTNPKRIKQAIKKKACNALLLKVNQIGTVTEAIEACKTAQKAGWGVMVSHRSGETCDSFIADLAVGLGTGQIKSGAPCRGERLAKYNQLLRIEEELGTKAKYAGRTFRRP